MVNIPDLRGASSAEPTEVTTAPGAIIDGTQWDLALAKVRLWAADSSACSRRPDGARRSAGFEVSIDGGGRAIVAVADQPSAACLARVLASCVEREGSEVMLESV